MENPNLFLDRGVPGLLPPQVNEGGVIPGNSLHSGLSSMYEGGSSDSCGEFPPTPSTSRLFPNIWKIALRNGTSKSFSFLALFPNYMQLHILRYHQPRLGESGDCWLVSSGCCFYSSALFWHISSGVLTVSLA